MIAKRVSAIALAVALSSGVTLFAASPVLAEDRCGIDAQMAAALDRANKNDEDIIEKVRKEVNESIKKADVKDKKCLASLDAIQALMNMRLPSLSGLMGGLLDMLKDMACEMADDFIDRQINDFGMSFGDPYGIVNVGIGGTTGGDGGLVVDTYEIDTILKDAAVDAVVGAIENKAGGVTGGGSFSSQIKGPSDRNPRRVEDTINDGVRNAFEGL